MRDPGLAAERTALARRRTTLPFLVVALLGARAALEATVPGLLLALVAAGGAVLVLRRRPNEIALLVVLLAGTALLVPG